MIKLPIKFENIKKKINNIKLSKNKSFYIVLIVCLTTIAVTAYLSYMGQKADITGHNMMAKSINETEQKGKIQEDVHEKTRQSQEVQDEEQVSKKETDAEKPVLSDQMSENPSQLQNASQKPKPRKEKPVSINLNTMIKPVFGEIIKPFSMDRPVYSETLKHWETHKGIDIKTEQGTPVKAALSGTVEEVIKDPRLGWKVVLNHGNEVKTLYANLTKEILVKEGEYVKKATVIGAVGQSALVEVADPPHLHFELIKAGKHIDPMYYLPQSE